MRWVLTRKAEKTRERLGRPVLPRAVAAVFCVGSYAVFAQCGPPATGSTSLCAPNSPPMSAGYSGDQQTSGILFVHSLDERWGDSSRNNAPSVAQGAGGQPLTMRVAGQGPGAAVGALGFKTDSRTGTARFGGDASQWSLFNSTDKLHLGAMGGYGFGGTASSSSGNTFNAAGRPSSGSAGVYSTWYQDDRSRLGWYSDVYGQVAWTDNSTETPWVNRSNYASNAGMASAEAGYSLQLGDTSPWTIKPQGQLIYLRSNNYNLADTQFTTVDGLRRNGWLSRLGVRVQPEGFQAWGMKLRPYAAANWWHDESSTEVIANTYAPSALGPNNRYELKTGVNVDVLPGMAAWGDLGMQWGQQSYQAWTLRAGMRYAW
ncbi:autotransporter outer membrane beta-barrel domain-containing protein [Variovorax sp. Sphag1AA]|uniref:autotransporter outer membrane beta-barrel domain-containing protein n=1 Tax=Variovorax sp. Sphag1AA TaxID=2587027 RepID=UPI0021A7DB50|nr:autotransporter outer membrane beta-barrel domain-containing protein [Variovorax sp. Sphag1AA]